MKHNSTVRILSGIALFAFGLSPAALADNKGCSNITVKGTYAFTGTGSFVSPAALAGPFAEVGTQSFDGRGGTTYAATLSQNGNIVSVAATGTYTVNPDCTGTMTVQVAPFGVTVHLFFAINDAGNEFRAIETEPGGVITRIARRQFPDGDWRQ
jgi:hypothetical protein